MSLLDRLRAAVGDGTELPCGCVVTDAVRARFSDGVEELDRELVEVSAKRYENATVHDHDWRTRYRCKECGAEWTEYESASRKTDYGEKNPGVGVRLDVDHRPGPAGGTWVHSDEPVVEE